MAGTYTYELDFRNKRYQSAAAGLQAVAKSMDRSIDDFGVIVSRELRSFLKKSMIELATKHSKPWPGGTTSNTLSRRSGKGYLAIRDSWAVKDSKNLNAVEGTLTLPARYAVHEKGAIIRPRKAKYLTIPLPAALRSNGTPIKRKARDWKNTFVATSKKGNLLIFQTRGTKIVPLYILKKSVKIPPRLGLVRHMKQRLPRFVDRAMESLLDELLKDT